MQNEEDARVNKLNRVGKEAAKLVASYNLTLEDALNVYTGLLVTACIVNGISKENVKAQVGSAYNHYASDPSYID